MSLKISFVKQNKKPVKIFLIAILVGISFLYLLCDYYLNSIGKELMINWVRAESASIQEGNLLTSSTKNQRIILSSDYIKAVKLVKIEQDQNNQTKVRERLQFGEVFNIEPNDIPVMTEEVVIETVGFLHKKSFYKIPGRDEMYMIFDVESKMLDTVFFVVSAILLLMVIALVALIRSVEEKEFLKREEIFKQAINDFVSKDKPSDVIINDFPTLTAWWKSKKDQVLTAQDIAIKNQTKIMLGETASRVGHDIMGSIRNIEILFKRTSGLDANQTTVFNESVNKIKSLAADISKRTKQSISEQSLNSNDSAVNLDYVLSSLIEQKRIQYGNDIKFTLNFEAQNTILNGIDLVELERSISNLINNAAEASIAGSEVFISVINQSGLVQIQIKDHGHGISPENLKKIGVKGFTANKANGTGIGIFYAKQFVEQIGGRLVVESVIGAGTVVNLMVPV